MGVLQKAVIGRITRIVAVVLGAVTIGLTVPTAAVAAEWPPPCGFSLYENGSWYHHCGFNRAAIRVDSDRHGVYEMCVDPKTITGWPSSDRNTSARIVGLCR